MEVVIDVPQEIQTELEHLSRREHRTVNEIVQESIRRYLEKELGSALSMKNLQPFAQARQLTTEALIREARRQSLLVGAHPDPDADAWEDDFDDGAWR